MACSSAARDVFSLRGRICLSGANRTRISCQAFGYVQDLLVRCCVLLGFVMQLISCARMLQIAYTMQETRAPLGRGEAGKVQQVHLAVRPAQRIGQEQPRRGHRHRQRHLHDRASSIKTMRSRAALRVASHA